MFGANAHSIVVMSFRSLVLDKRSEKEDVTIWSLQLELVRQILQDGGRLDVLHFITHEPAAHALADTFVLEAGQEIQLPLIKQFVSVVLLELLGSDDLLWTTTTEIDITPMPSRPKILI